MAKSVRSSGPRWPGLKWLRTKLVYNFVWIDLICLQMFPKCFQMFSKCVRNDQGLNWMYRSASGLKWLRSEVTTYLLKVDAFRESVESLPSWCSWVYLKTPSALPLACWAAGACGRLYPVATLTNLALPLILSLNRPLVEPVVFLCTSGTVLTFCGWKDIWHCWKR